MNHWYSSFMQTQQVQKKTPPLKFERFQKSQKRLWAKLTTPSPAVMELVARRQAQALSVLMLLITTLGFIMTVLPLWLNRSEEIAIPPLVLRTVILLICAFAYLLSRTRYHRVGSALVIGTMFVGIFTLILSDPTGIPNYIVSLTMIVLLTSILSSLRQTIGVMLLNMICVLSLFFIQPQDSPLTIIFPLANLTVISVLIIANLLYHQKLETDRKAELAASEFRYRQMFEVNQAIKWVIDPVTHRIVDANQAACEFYGYSHEAMVNKNLGDINMLSADELAVELRTAADQNHTYLNIKHRLASGEIRDVEIYTGPVNDHGRKLLFSILHDVTEQRRTEEARRTSEEQLRSLITSMADTVYSIDLEGRFLVYHQPARPQGDTLITPPNRLIGQRYRDLLPTDLAVQLEHSIALVSTTFNTETLDYSQTVDGEKRHYSARVSPLLNAEMRFRGVTVVARDVTLTVQAQERQNRLFEFEQLDRMIAAIFLQAADPEAGIPVALKMAGDFIGLSAARVMQFRDNEQLMDTTYEWDRAGIKSQQENLSGIPFPELIPSLTPMLTHDGIIIASHPSELPKDLEILALRLGVQAIVEMPFYVDGRLQGLVNFVEMRGPRTWLPEEVATLRSIAESYGRMLENQKSRLALIQARDDALRSARLKSEFVSNMSHEVRTPMTGVIGMLELLVETALDNDQKEFAEAAFNSAHNLLHIVDDILDFSKIEAGKIILEVKSIDIRGMIGEVRTTLSTHAAKKKISLTADIADNVPMWISGDPTRLRQILVNLVNNAIKFTHTGGVHITLWQLSGLMGRSRLHFEIADTGIGIATEQVERIFDSFVQADGSTTRKYGGSGLGLAICQQLIQLMGGYIEVQSIVGKGSTFAFNLTFPVVPESGTNRQLAALHHLCVMVLDTESTPRYMLAQQLKMWGITVIEAPDKATARQMLRETVRIINVIFCRIPLFADDTSVDDMSADAALQFVTQLRAEMGATTPSLIQVSEGEALLNDGQPVFDAYLRRPVRQSELFEVLSDVVHALEANDAVSEADTPTTPPPVHILMVENNAFNCEIIKHSLARTGIQVDCVTDGPEVLNLLVKGHYDLVLLDIYTSNLDGLTTALCIRAMTGLPSNIPIVALTTNVLPEAQHQCFEAGINEVLGKPCSIEILRKTILDVVRPAPSLFNQLPPTQPANPTQQ